MSQPDQQTEAEEARVDCPRCGETVDPTVDQDGCRDWHCPMRGDRR